MSIEQLGKSLLADAKASRASRERKAEKRAEKEALIGLGVNLLGGVANRILTTQAQNDYVNNFENNIEGLDLKRVKSVSDHFGTLVNEKKKSKQGWNAFTRSWLRNQYRDPVLQKIRPELRGEGREWESLIDQYVTDENVNKFASLFEEMETYHDQADYSPAVRDRAYQIYSKTNPTTIGGWVTNKVAGAFDGKTDAQVKQDALNAIKNTKAIRGNTELLAKWDEIENERDALGIASELLDLETEAKKIRESDKTTSVTSKIQQSGRYAISVTTETTTDARGNSTQKIIKQKNFDLMSEAEKDEDLVKNWVSANDPQDYVITHMTNEGRLEVVRRLKALDKPLSLTGIKSTEDYNIIQDVITSVSEDKTMLNPTSHEAALSRSAFNIELQATYNDYIDWIEENHPEPEERAARRKQLDEDIKYLANQYLGTGIEKPLEPEKDLSTEPGEMLTVPFNRENQPPKIGGSGTVDGTYVPPSS